LDLLITAHLSRVLRRNITAFSPVPRKKKSLQVERVMDQEFKPGQIVPESGVYRITHDPQHADMPARGHGHQGPAVPDMAPLQRHQL